MINANLHGFLPGNDAYENSKALQALVDFGGEIVVEQAGVYDFSEGIEIGDDTTLRFAKGVQLRRQQSRKGRNEIAFVNKGVATRTYNKNIQIIGLHLDCNGIECDDWGENSRLFGLRACVGMVFIKNLVIEDYECVGSLKKDYGIQVSAFENIRLEHLYIAGEKDGVHLGWGKGFIIRHARFCTFDDPVALNAFDYIPSNVHVGWIEDGIVEDCYDLDAEETTGYFCRLLGGAWCDWYAGMKVQFSDTVCSNGRVYRVMARADGQTYTSLTPPCHESGLEEYDGIKWLCVRDEAVYDCGCRNIILRDIHLQKKRKTAIGISLNYDVWANSYYPGCTMIPQENLAFERIYVENEMQNLIVSTYPTKHITIKDTDLKDTQVRFVAKKLEGITYPALELTLENVTRKEDSITWSEGHPVHIIEG